VNILLLLLLLLLLLAWLLLLALRVQRGYACMRAPRQTIMCFCPMCVAAMLVVLGWLAVH
jgi:hypothetical protein